MEISDEDNTAVLRMKRDFKAFLSKDKKPSNTSRSHLPIAGSFLDDESPTNNSAASSVSMQQILGTGFKFVMPMIYYYLKESWQLHIW